MDPKKAFLLRISPDLWKEIESWSAQELRSVNGQIEYLLRQAVAQHKKSAAPAPFHPPEAPPQNR